MSTTDFMIDFLRQGGYVDTSRVRRALPWRGEDLAAYARDFALPSLMQGAPLLRDHTSLGWVVTWPARTVSDLVSMFEHDAYNAFMFAGGTTESGDDAEIKRYIANAIRKVWGMVALRGDDTLQMKYSGFDEFPCPVESSVLVDGVVRFPVGTFGHGGGVTVEQNGAMAYAALSALDEHEDRIGGYMVGLHPLTQVAKGLNAGGDVLQEFMYLRDWVEGQERARRHATQMGPAFRR